MQKTVDSGQTSHFCSVYCGSERFHCVDGFVDRWTMNDEGGASPKSSPKGKDFCKMSDGH